MRDAKGERKKFPRSLQSIDWATPNDRLRRGSEQSQIYNLALRVGGFFVSRRIRLMMYGYAQREIVRCHSSEM